MFPFGCFGILEILHLSQLLLQVSHLFTEQIEILGLGDVDLHLHLENFCPFGEHQSGKSVAYVLLIGMDVGEEVDYSIASETVLQVMS